MSTASSATSSADARDRRYEIGDVAILVTLSLRTVRFYEQEGLLVPVGRTDHGIPLYDNDALDRFFLIKKMKPLGFTVEEMRSLLTLREEIGKPGLTPLDRAQVRDRLQTWVSLAEEKLASLEEQVRLAEDFMLGLRDDAARSLRADPDAHSAQDLFDDTFLNFLTEPLHDGDGDGDGVGGAGDGRVGGAPREGGASGAGPTSGEDETGNGAGPRAGG
ncbi:MerR family transcriptional regulator [Frankia sp. R82]|uniref:MerR family transcriptional regulator n=1 Tax=Frankia sp. R82 TaxID=2950553 RepID=UPI002043291D|nr:MerR family transcriptional regulator [Frankia sp. R82]MCM3886779.1 MerR family transcriptional regulator [Frankia sp. R82]